MTDQVDKLKQEIEHLKWTILQRDMDMDKMIKAIHGLLGEAKSKEGQNEKPNHTIDGVVDCDTTCSRG